MYTPGTTGIPKGAMLTHGNFLAQLPVTEHFDITDEDVRLSHLPFSHVFGLSADLFASALFGTTIAISHTFVLTVHTITYIWRLWTVRNLSARHSSTEC